MTKFTTEIQGNTVEIKNHFGQTLLTKYKHDDFDNLTIQVKTAEGWSMVVHAKGTLAKFHLSAHLLFSLVRKAIEEASPEPEADADDLPVTQIE